MDDGPGPVMREQSRLRPTMAAAMSYGEGHPEEFGGVYWENTAVVRIVFLATGHVEEHLRALRRLVPHPDRIVVRNAQHSERQNQAWLEVIRRRLVERTAEFGVTGWGMERTEKGRGITVWIWPWSEEAAERVRQELDPIPVHVDAMPPAVPLGGAP